MIIRPIPIVRSLALLLAGAATTCIASSSAMAQVIRLAGAGELLVGEVEDATSEGLTFRRLDNGGVLALRWSDLAPGSAESVRRMKGLLVEDDDEITAIADVLIYEIAGGIRQEFVGRIVGEDRKNITMRRKGSNLDIPRESIKNRKKREVPIYEIYTRDDYYQEQLAAANPGSNADKHIGLADVLRRSGDFENAEKHLLEAQKLGGGLQQVQLPQMLARIQFLRESADERALLAEIRAMRNRKNFSRAQELVTDFESRFPESKLVADLNREKRRIERDLEAHTVDRMRTMWGKTIHNVATAKVNEPKLTLAMARDYAENAMAGDIFAQMAKVLDVEPELTRTLWQERQKHGKGSTTIYSYGVGSWVLGADDIIKGTKVEKGQEQAGELGNSQDPEIRRLQRLISEARKRSRSAARNSGSGDEEVTDEAWWEGLKTAEKRNWLRAYFAEYGGQLELTQQYTTPCQNCNGVGTTEEIGASGGQPRKVECPVCHGTRYMRLFRAR